MSSEVTKKRGRPKKAISDPIEVDVPDTKKSTTRAKSTKATPKVVKASTAAPPKPIIAQKAVPKPVTKPAMPPKAASPPPPAPAKVAPPVPPVAPTKPTVKTPVTPETSKILSKVRELSAKSVPSPEQPTKPSRLAATPTTSKPTPPPSQPKAVSSQPPEPHGSNFKPPPSSPPPSATAAKPTAKPHVPIAALNSAIVSNITTRAGARPNTSGSKQLPGNYNSVAKKVTLAIVAMPVAIVTSWVLYERFVLGEERKLLVKPGLAMVEAPSGAGSKATETSSGS